MKNKIDWLCCAALLSACALQAQNCPCKNGTADYSVDCDGDGVDDACKTGDCPSPSISGSAYVEESKTTTLTASSGLAPYTWSLKSGGSYISVSGSGASATITGSSPGKGTVEVKDKHGNTGSHEVTCFQFELDVAQTSVEDGEQDISVDIKVKPQSVESLITNIQLEATKPGGGTSFDNPDGEGIELEQDGGDPLSWKIKLARWYEDGSKDCANDSTYWNAAYDIKGTYDLDGSSYDIEPDAFGAYVGLSIAIADVVGYYSLGGKTFDDMVTVRERKQGTTTYYSARIDASNLTRFMQVRTAIPHVLQNSQFYSMVADEENHHAAQFKHSVDGIVNPRVHWSTEQVRHSIHGAEFDGMSKSSAHEMAIMVIYAALKHEDRQSFTEVSDYNNSSSLRCSLERAAKNAAGAKYFLRLKCSYPNCK